jgi:hypothetical protein
VLDCKLKDLIRAVSLQHVMGNEVRWQPVTNPGFHVSCNVPEVRRTVWYNVHNFNVVNETEAAKQGCIPDQSGIGISER